MQTETLFSMFFFCIFLWKILLLIVISNLCISYKRYTIYITLRYIMYLIDLKMVAFELILLTMISLSQLNSNFSPLLLLYKQFVM